MTQVVVPAAAAVMVQPAEVTAAEVMTVLDGHMEQTSAAAVTEAAADEVMGATAEPAAVGALLADGHDEQAVVGQEMTVEEEMGVVVEETNAEVDAPTERVSAAAVTEVVQEMVVAGTAGVTMAETATVGASNIERRDQRETVEDASEETPYRGGGRRWKGIHIGVWVTIGAGVAVGAALWARRR